MTGHSPMPPHTVSLMVSDTLTWSWRGGASPLHTLLSQHSRALRCLYPASRVAHPFLPPSLSLVLYRGDPPTHRGLSHPIRAKPFLCRSTDLQLRGVVLVGIKRSGGAHSVNLLLAGPLSQCPHSYPPPHHLLHFTTPPPPKLQTPLFHIRPPRGRGTRATMRQQKFL